MVNPKHKQGRILSEFWQERDRQVTEEGYTPDHDDQHTPSEWLDWIIQYATKARGRGTERTRRAGVIIGALCLAMIESLDRKTAGGAPEAPDRPRDVPADPGWYVLEEAIQDPPVLRVVSVRMDLGETGGLEVHPGSPIYLDESDRAGLLAAGPILRWRPATDSERAAVGWRVANRSKPAAESGPPVS